MKNILISQSKPKAQTIVMTRETIVGIMALAVFGAVMILVISSLRTSTTPDTFTINNESMSIAGGSGILGSFVNGLGSKTLLNGTVVLNNVSNNSIGIPVNVAVFPNGSVIFQAGARTASQFGITEVINASYQTQQPSNTQQAIDNSTLSIVNTFVQLPLFGTIIGLFLVIGGIFILLRFRGEERGGAV